MNEGLQLLPEELAPTPIFDAVDSKLRDSSVFGDYGFSNSKVRSQQYAGMTSKIKELERLLLEKDAELDQLRQQRATQNFDELWETSRNASPLSRHANSPSKPLESDSVKVFKVLSQTEKSAPLVEIKAAREPSADHGEREQELFWNAKADLSKPPSSTETRTGTLPDEREEGFFGMPVERLSHLHIDTPASIKSLILKQQKNFEEKLTKSEAEGHRKLMLAMRQYKRLKLKYDSLLHQKPSNSREVRQTAVQTEGSLLDSSYDRLYELAAICGVEKLATPTQTAQAINACISDNADKLKRMLQLYKSGTSSLLELQGRIKEAQLLLESLHDRALERGATASHRSSQAFNSEALSPSPGDNDVVDYMSPIRKSRARFRDSSTPERDESRVSLVQARPAQTSVTMPDSSTWRVPNASLSDGSLHLCISLERNAPKSGRQRRLSLDDASEKPRVAIQKEKCASASPRKACNISKSNPVHLRPFYV